MNISDCSFQKLPYPNLFKTYLNNFSKLKDFYPYSPFDENDILRRAKSLENFQGRKEGVEALSELHKSLGIANQQKQLDKLAKDNAVAVVTGQQTGIYGGPLFTIYKAITAILLSRKFEKELNIPVVPVFWMADEDHDFDEVAWLGIQVKDDFEKLFLNQKGNGKPVAVQNLEESIEDIDELIQDSLYETEFTNELREQYQRHYKTGKTFGQAFAGLLNEWFGDEGLLIAGSNHPAVKKIAAPFMQKSISESGEIYDAIEKQSQKLERDFHRQVMNGDSNLFYLSEQEGRVKIHREENCWKAGSIKWKEELLLQEIIQKPEKFSPNVFLRPVIQEAIIPGLGYVAGPGEIAYYGQMKYLYKYFNMEMPPVFPRFCATIIEAAIARIAEKLPFEYHEYEQRLEDLESAFVEQTETTDLESLFESWKKSIKKSAENPIKIIDEIDPTLKGRVGKTVAGFEHEIDKVRGRVIRSIKKQQDVQLKRIERIKINLFPDGGLQERAVSPLYFMNKYGIHIWKQLLENIDEKGLDLKNHHLIEL